MPMYGRDPYLDAYYFPHRRFVMLQEIPVYYDKSPVLYSAPSPVNSSNMVIKPVKLGPGVGGFVNFRHGASLGLGQVLLLRTRMMRWVTSNRYNKSSWITGRCRHTDLVIVNFKLYEDIRLVLSQGCLELRKKIRYEAMQKLLKLTAVPEERKCFNHEQHRRLLHKACTLVRVAFGYT